MQVGFVELVAAALFALAVLHTFITGYFERLAHRHAAHAGIWHLFAEVEAVFGIWAAILLLFIAIREGSQASIAYLEGLNFAEPMFVFVIMVVAASKPILQLCLAIVTGCARLLPLAPCLSFYLVVLTLVPLLGSFITEPAAMTLAALLLRDRFYSRGISSRLKYATLGVLFVNISIGGTLTSFAAPPVLMVAGKWGWDTAYMFTHFGWKAAIAVMTNAALVTALFRKELCAMQDRIAMQRETPLPVMAVHLAFLVGVIVFAHHPVVFVVLFLLFLGFTEAYRHYQDRLILREGLMVALFLAGLVVLGSLQKWWLQPALTGLDDTALYFGATALTAITDNAALTYLGSLVEGTDEGFRYALVAGAVTGGGLTIIANAPNPAGVTVLKNYFDNQFVNPFSLLIAALVPTIVAIVCFLGL